MSARQALWLATEPLVLASASSIRRAILDSAGIPVEAVPAGIDERALEAGLARADARDSALLLSEAKAETVSGALPGRYVLGADQTLAVGGRTLHKPQNRQQAADHLALLSGRVHQLHAGLALARNGRTVWRHVETARLSVRPLSAGFIHAYLDAAGEGVCASVGVYQIEDLGMHLFEAIEGDHTTIMGLPLLPLLRQLRNMNLLHS